MAGLLLLTVPTFYVCTGSRPCILHFDTSAVQGHSDGVEEKPDQLSQGLLLGPIWATTRHAVLVVLDVPW